MAERSVTQVIGFSERLDAQDRTLILCCTEDGLVWGYVAEHGHRVSDSQFDVAGLTAEEQADWGTFASDWLKSSRGCYHTHMVGGA